jgi:hypothetical protein
MVAQVGLELMILLPQTPEQQGLPTWDRPCWCVGMRASVPDNLTSH